MPWAQSTPRTPQPTYGSNSTDDQSKPSHNLGQTLAPPTPPATGRSFAGSGTSTPSSAGFVSLETLTNKLHKHKTKKFDAQNGELDQETQDGSEDEIPDFLRYDETTGLDKTRYAVLFNDWPYNTPYGVRHYCVWSRVSLPMLFREIEVSSNDITGSDSSSSFSRLRPNSMGTNRIRRFRRIHRYNPHLNRYL